ncbi:MAG: PhzF family phenazine biosynthesis protein [Alphaproteobacteria bacterium]
MDLALYQIDAFTDRIFKGNPAAVCPLDHWPGPELLQFIAAENNLSETAFFVPEPERGRGHYHMRWFTPTDEVDLCGHATLASAYVLFTELEPDLPQVIFRTRSGDLTVTREADGGLTMDFPRLDARPIEAPGRLIDVFEETLGARPLALLRAVNLLAIYESEDDVRRLRYNPDLREMLVQADAWGLIVSAPAREGSDHDFVSRFFAPHKGVPEDPVTGSAHCTLMPYWSGRFGKTDLIGYQASARGGTVRCRIDLDRPARVFLSGQCAFYMKGTIRLA